jgi:hypothetical protein
VEIQSDTIGTPVTLAGPGPHAPVAAKRAAEFATVEETTPTLLNVQSPDEADDADPETRGQAAIKWVAERAALEPDEYDAEVVVSEDTESAIIDAVGKYNTVCVGLSEEYVCALARKVDGVIRQNIVVSLGVKALLAIGVPVGLITVAVAVVVGDMGMSLGVTGNAVRLSRMNPDSLTA